LGRPRPRSFRRRLVQAAVSIGTNAYLPGFAKGTVYGGGLKAVCAPGLNCYACPGAVLSCPIGALQTQAASAAPHIPYYLIGFFLVAGGVLGRFVCGFLCPFGLVQELLHKIPFARKLGTFRGDRPLRALKYVILALFVVLLPLCVDNAAGGGQPWFCEWICPAGTLEGGVPLTLGVPALRRAIGFLFAWKMGILVALALLSAVLYRPFCRYLCPLGAIYALFNRVALLRYRVDEAACTGCGSCAEGCPMALDPRREPNHPECVRCGRCTGLCPTGALSLQGAKPFGPGSTRPPS